MSISNQSIDAKWQKLKALDKDDEEVTILKPSAVKSELNQAKSISKGPSFRERIDTFEFKTNRKKSGGFSFSSSSSASSTVSPFKEKVESFEKFSKNKKKNIVARPPKYTSTKPSVLAPVTKVNGKPSLERKDSSNSLSKWISMPTLKEEIQGDKKDPKAKENGKPHWTAVFSTRMSQIRQRFENRCSAEKARNAQQQIRAKIGPSKPPKVPTVREASLKDDDPNGKPEITVNGAEGMTEKKDDDNESNFGSHILEWETKWDSLDRQNSKKGDTKPLTPVPWRKSSLRPLSYAGENEIYEKAGYGEEGDSEKGKVEIGGRKERNRRSRKVSLGCGESGK